MKLRVPEMEGRSARWYAKQRGSAPQMSAYRRSASKLSAEAPGATVLEVAPGPGYHAVELARLGHPVTGLDISHTMVEIARETAVRAGVDVDFRPGDATAMPFGDGSFDLVVCQAAFKNFLDPTAALNEMRRVLRPGGLAVIQDLNSEATRADIAAEVAAMGLSAVNAALTRLTLSWLRRRARTVAQWRELTGEAEIRLDGLSLEVRLRA
ncbi:class I SAM-dependent methyltransferase [Actinoplanes sp. NPDC051470]|uniref:class I SAM-dependent methyltransferase n=1 Tax=Actinoplanes sp. NPDC051470 TaxID=3157224 RepID=UPI0034417921